MQLDFFKAYCYYLHLPRETMYRMAMEDVNQWCWKYRQQVFTGESKCNQEGMREASLLLEASISWLGGGYRDRLYCTELYFHSLLSVLTT